jgi:hypothetical protein
VYDYLLGGKDDFAADRAVADQIIAQLPAVQVGVRAQRDLLVQTLYRALPAGSYVFIHHMLDSEDPASATLQAAMQNGLGRTQFRTFAQIRELFGGLELVEPGVVLVPDWRPDPGTPGVQHHPVLGLAAAGVARKA